MPQQTRWRWTRRGMALALLGTAVAGMTGEAVSQQPAPQLQPPPAAQPPAPITPAGPVAVIHGSYAISHEEFGKFLMDRGGAEKLEIFVNKKIIELAAQKQGITVTDTELKAAFQQSVATAGESVDGKMISERDFIRVVLPKFGKTYYEWMEDIERPRLLLTKMCRADIKISEEDLKLQFDRRFGEMRQVQMIIWPKGDNPKTIQAIWDRIRNNSNEFDSEARKQANPGLAAVAGHIKPITKHLVAEDKNIEIMAFKLKEGEVSEPIPTGQGFIVMKLVKVIPPNSEAKFEAQRAMLEKAAIEAKLEEAIPKYFAKLREAARPELKYVGPSEWKVTSSYLDSLPDITKTSGTIPTPGAGK